MRLLVTGFETFNSNGTNGQKSWCCSKY